LMVLAVALPPQQPPRQQLLLPQVMLASTPTRSWIGAGLACSSQCRTTPLWTLLCIATCTCT